MQSGDPFGVAEGFELFELGAGQLEVSHCVPLQPFQETEKPPTQRYDVRRRCRS